ncbi:MAG TPA: BTAD domain-containing putative transcriptional regulator [Streptosporangiaceae bacterium]
MKVGLLGPLTVTGDDGGALTRPTAPGQRALLALLALRAGTTVRTEALAAALWGATPPRTAAKTIQMYVSGLRKALPPGVLETVPGGYRLAVRADDVDVDRFERHIQDGHTALGEERFAAAAASLRQALSLWREAPLPDLAGQPPGQAEVVRLAELRYGGEEDLAEARLALGEHAMMVAGLEAAVAAEPFRERRWAQLMLALYRCGRQADALGAYRRLRTLLADELGLEPSGALAALEEAILLQKTELDWSPPPDVAQPDPPRDPAWHNLPAALTSLVGREGETGQVVRLVREHRAVTLTGPGGAGKTRLAVAAAGELLADFPDGVWFADLAPIADGGLVAQVAADVMGLRLRSGRPALEVLCDTMADSELLLILDNGEHVIAGCALVAERMLAACPRLRVLTTSREQLRIAGEVSWAVPPLGLPDLADDATAAAIGAAGAVRLFADRAVASGPGAPLSPAELRAIGRIVTALDGLPLAIELAAARAASIGVSELAARLDDRFGLLSGGRRLAPARQQTLAATIEWSYQLLDERQRTVLNRLSVFAGSFALADAEAIVAGAGIAARQIAALIGDLADRSMVQLTFAGDGEVRYRLLETIRHYAALRLAGQAGGQPAAERWADRHADHFTSKARTLAQGLTDPRQYSVLAQVELDHDNLRKALTRTAGQPDRADDLVLTIAALRRYFPTFGHIREGMAFLQASLAQDAPALLAPARTWALITASFFSMYSDLKAARAYADQALRLARDARDTELTVEALYLMAVACHFTGDHPAGRRAGEEAVALARDLADPVLLGTALIGLALDIDDPSVQRNLEEAVEVTRASGDIYMRVLAVENLGCVYLARRAPEAAGYFRESHSYALFPDQFSGARLNLGWIALDDGDLATAGTHMRTMVRAALRAWDPLFIAVAVLGLACWHAAAGRPADAVAMLVFADRTAEAASMVFLDEERGRREDLLTRLHEQLGDQFAGLDRGAEQMSRQELTALALAEPVT